MPGDGEKREILILFLKKIAHTIKATGSGGLPKI